MPSPIPARYLPEPVDPAALPGWLGWSLPYFSEPVAQNPHVDLSLQLDVTAAYARYRSAPEAEQLSFFAFLVWHLAQTLARHPSFNLRCVDGQWYRLGNPPIFIPVAVGGDARFKSLILEDVVQQDYPNFLAQYQARLARARSLDQPDEPDAGNAFNYAHFMGNLPNLRFTGLTLHWRQDQMIGQSSFYFGQRYDEGAAKLIPLAVKMHHSCTDPFVLDQLLADFNSRFAL
jgi:chloramphenicol O-acetyltransferase type A